MISSYTARSPGISGVGYLSSTAFVYAEDPDDLDFWLSKQRRIWSDMKRRQQKASVQDLLRRIRHS